MTKTETYPQHIEAELGTKGPDKLSEINEGQREALERELAESLGGVLDQETLQSYSQENPKVGSTIEFTKNTVNEDRRKLSPIPGGLVELRAGNPKGSVEEISAERTVILEQMQRAGATTREADSLKNRSQDTTEVLQNGDIKRIPKSELPNLKEEWKNSDPLIYYHEGGGVAAIERSAQNAFGATITELDTFDVDGELTNIHYIYEQTDRSQDV